MRCRTMVEHRMEATAERRAGPARVLDLASPASVEDLAETLREEGRPIDPLINNAGVMAPADPRRPRPVAAARRCRAPRVTRGCAC